MPDETLPTLAESALRGIACRCPRCGKGKLFAGFLDLRPNCEACGLDYAFTDVGDGAAIFVIMIPGAIVVTCGADRGGEVPAAVLAARRVVAAAGACHHAVAAARDQVAADRAAVPSQGGAGPADRPRTGMIARGQDAGGTTTFAIFTLVMVAAFVGLGIWQLQRRVEKHALIAALTERLAAAPEALPDASQWRGLTPARDEFRRVSFARAMPAPDAMVYSSGSAVREDISGPGTWAFIPARLASGETVVINAGFVANTMQDREQQDRAVQRLVTGSPVTLTAISAFRKPPAH